MVSVKSVIKSVRISPRKARIVLNKFKNMTVLEAHKELQFPRKKAEHIFKQLLNTALADAENNFGLDIDNLVVKNVVVDEGSRLKRFMARAKGRAGKIIKRTSHIAIILEDILEQ